MSEKLKGQRIGLIAFAGQAYWQCPLTSDIKAFENFLSLLDTDAVPFYGTNIAAPIDLACESLEKVPSAAKAIVIITDGESFDGNLEKSLTMAKESQTKSNLHLQSFTRSKGCFSKKRCKTNGRLCNSCF